jgi:hypothetical protein
MGDKRAQVRDDYNIAMGGPRASWASALTAATPTEQQFSAGFGARYTNLGREQAATQAAGRYASALAPAQMQTAGGRAQTAAVMAQTRAAVAQAEAANAMGLEQAQIGLGQQNWQNKFNYAGLQGQNMGFAAQQAGANANIQEAAIGAQEARKAQYVGLATTIAGSLLGPAVGAIGSTIGGAVGGMVGKSAFGGKEQLKFANGGQTRERRMIVGDPQRNGMPNPEMVTVMNPGPNTSLRIVPLQDMGRQPLPAMRRFAYGTEMTPRLVKRRRR